MGIGHFYTLPILAQEKVLQFLDKYDTVDGARFVNLKRKILK